MNNDMKDVLKTIKDSPFRRSSYQVDISLSDFHKGVMMYLNDDKHTNGFINSDIFLSVPKFQRDNDKWSLEMKVSYIENLIKGCDSVIMLYEISPKGKISTLENCYILDGLQRITAIHEFVEGLIKPFGKSYKDLVEGRILHSTLCRIKLRIYTFETEKEAVDFYIAMNENITHSKKDIEKAKKYLEGIINE